MAWYIYRTSDNRVVGMSVNEPQPASGFSKINNPTEVNGPGAGPNKIIDGSSLRNQTQAEIDVFALADKKLERISAVDTKTDQLIASGFEFDNELFSTSINAQMNWTTLFMNKTVWEYPMAVTTLANTEYLLPDAMAVSNFYFAGLSHIKSQLDSGRALKSEIVEATNMTELNGIVDNR